MTEIRCPAKLHGIMVEDGVIEVRCRSRFCGYRPGVLILHKFSVITGKLVQTLRFKDPRHSPKE